MNLRPTLLAALLAVAACQQSAPAVRPSPAPAPPSPPPALRQPVDAVLADSDVGRPRTAGRDHLGATEAARDEPNEVLAARLFAGWAWVDMATRTWGPVDDRVLLTLRAEGATRAYQWWAAEAARPPFTAAACPAEVTRLDQCSYGTSAGSAIVVGRLDSETFRLVADPASIARLAALQAARLRAA